MYFSISELMGLPGLPSDRSAIGRKAIKENWQSRQREGRGGGKEYFVESLPVETQEALGYFTQSESEPVQVKFSVDQSRVHAVLRLQNAFEMFRQEYCPNELKLFAELQFCKLYQQRELLIDEDIYEIIPRISRTKLCRDRQLLKAEGTQALGRYGKRLGLIEGDSELQEAIETCIVSGKGNYSPKQILKLLETQFSLKQLPSEHQIRRWVQNFAQSEPMKFTAYKSKDEYKNVSAPSFGKRDQGILRPNQEWQMDSSPTDIMLSYEEDGEIKKKRFALVGCIDVFTRRTKLLVVETSKAEAVSLLMRQCILDWGVPESIRLDNGKDYKSKQVNRFATDLKIVLKYCTPHQPQEKPFIERFFRTFSHSELELLPGFIGHSISDRQKLRAHADWNEKATELEMSRDAFQEWCISWCADYNNRPHSGLKNRSPIEVLASVQGWKKRTIEDARQLDFLCMQAEERIVQKTGFSLQGRIYNVDILGAYIGKKVHVRYDFDPNQVYVYSDRELSEFIAIAYCRDNQSPEQLAKNAAGAKAAAKEKLAEAKECKKAAKKIKKQIADNPGALIKTPDNVVVFQQKEDYTNTALETTKDAIRGKQKGRTLSEEEENKLRQDAAQREAERETKIQREKELRDESNNAFLNNLKRYEQILIQQKGGEALSDEDKRFRDLFARINPKNALDIRKRVNQLEEIIYVRQASG